MQNSPEEELSEISGSLWLDPLGWALWAFDWDNDPELKKVKLSEPWASKYNQVYGVDKWVCELLDDWREHMLSNKFDGTEAVPSFNAARTSGHGVGKSCASSIIILFIASTRPFCRGVVTANTSDQLKSKTWVELAKWKSKCATGHWFDLNSGKGNMRLSHKAHPETWRVDGLTSREENSESFAGLHNAGSMPFYLFDEASAIPDKIWEVAEGGKTDGEPAHFVFGNPTRNTGKFRECFRKMAKRWNHGRIDSQECQITNKKQIEEWRDDYGEDSDFFKVRVRGVFPSQSVRQFISEDIVLAAQDRGAVYDAYRLHPVILACDPAWMGDDELVIVMRQGPRFEVLHRELKTDNYTPIAYMLMQFQDKYKASAVFIDEGGGGTGIYSIGESKGYHWDLVNFGAKSGTDGYKNKRAEMWGLMRDWLMKIGSIPSDDQLFMDLIGPEIKPTIDGSIQLESKQDMKKRGIQSPNCADALALTFAMPVIGNGVYTGRVARKLKRY